MGVRIGFGVDVKVEAHRPRVSLTEVAKTPNAKSRDMDFYANISRDEGAELSETCLGGAVNTRSHVPKYSFNPLIYDVDSSCFHNFKTPSMHMLGMI